MLEKMSDFFEARLDGYDPQIKVISLEPNFRLSSFNIPFDKSMPVILHNGLRGKYSASSSPVPHPKSRT